MAEGRKAELKPIRRFLIFGRISGEIGIASLARSLTANEGGPREAQIHLALCCISLGKPRVLHLQQQAMALALAESQAWRRGH